MARKQLERVAFRSLNPTPRHLLSFANATKNKLIESRNTLTFISVNGLTNAVKRVRYLLDIAFHRNDIFAVFMVWANSIMILKQCRAGLVLIIAG